MDEYDYEADAEEILKVVLRKRTVTSEEVERLADYLKEKYSERLGRSEADMPERKTAGRPRKLGPVEVVKASVQGEDRLAARLMKEHDVKERIARKHIAEVKKGRERLRELMDSNDISSLIRKR